MIKYKVEGSSPEGNYLDGLEFYTEEDALKELKSLSYEFPHNEYWVDSYEKKEEQDLNLSSEDWFAWDDGWGIVGYSWECKACGNSSGFVFPYKDDTYTCEMCGAEHTNDFEGE